MRRGFSHVTVILATAALAAAQPSDVPTAFAATVALSADGGAALEFAADGTATQRVRLLPMGAFETRGKGRYIVQDLVHAQQIVALSSQYAGADDIAVDYDHQSVFAAIPGVGGTAPASGWIKPSALTAAADGIYAVITWTAEAAAKIKAKAYRYLSPNIAFDQATGRVTAILNAGLTNTPAINGLTTLAASAQPTQQEPQMDLTALALSLGLAPNATLTEIQAAQTAQAAALSAAQGQLAALNQALGLAGNADPTAALSAATALKAAGGTAALSAETQAQLATLTAAHNERIVDDHIKAGRVTPGQKAHYVALMRTDPASAQALMAGAPAVIVPGEQLTGQPAPGAAITALSADQKKAADMLGIAHDVYLADLKESAA